MKPIPRLAAVMGALLATVSQGETAPAPSPQADAPRRIPTEVYAPPHARHLTEPDCNGLFADSDACRTLSEGYEGWTQLSFMVDPSGKPFEITVTHSSGRKEFDKLAVEAISTSSFVPASVNGAPIESGYAFKYKFVLRGAAGAKPKFVADYKATAHAIDAGDRAAADAAIRKLEQETTNLYEDAYYGMATYLHAKKWGDERQQLAGLIRAIAEEDQAHYLPGDSFKAALQLSMQLQLSLHQYAEALDTYKKMQQAGIAAKVATALQPILEQLDKLRTDNTAYAVDGDMPSDGSWSLHLFKRSFQIDVSQGFIAQVKLRCAQNYTQFTFDPKLRYAIDGKDGDCWIELVGSPAASFKLIQF